MDSVPVIPTSDFFGGQSVSPIASSLDRAKSRMTLLQPHGL